MPYVSVNDISYSYITLDDTNENFTIFLMVFIVQSLKE